MISLYRVDSFKPIKEDLILRVPINRLNGEDSVIKRICVSRTIKGALRATGASSKDKICVLSHIIAESDSVVYPDKNLVPDVDVTDEVWLINYNFIILDQFQFIFLNPINRIPQPGGFAVYDYSIGFI